MKQEHEAGEARIREYARPVVPLGAALCTVVLGGMALLPRAAQAHDAKRLDATQLSQLTACPDADPVDSNDDTNAIKCALSVLCDTHGVLHLPAGHYRVKEPLTLCPGTQLVGDGLTTTILQSVGGDWERQSLLNLGPRTIVRDLRLDQDQPAPSPGWAPNPNYDFMVSINGDDVLLEDVLVLKAFKAIRVGTADYTSSIGRVLLRNIKGQPLFAGIQIDNGLDIIRVEDVHFWPFWSVSDPNNAAVVGWTQTNGTAVISRRNDNPLFSRIFALGYAVGVQLEASPPDCTNADICGVTSKAKFSQVDFDFCRSGFVVKSDSTRGILIGDYSFQGEPALNDATALVVTGKNSWLSVNQLDVVDASHSAVRLAGSGSFLSVTHAFVRNWNTAGNNAAAFRSTGANAKLWVKDCYVDVGGGAPHCDGAQWCEVAGGQPL